MNRSDEIMVFVCEKHGVSAAQILCHRREEKLVLARIEFSVLCRAQGWSLPVIGRMLNRDHSTIFHHLKKHQENQGDHP